MITIKRFEEDDLRRLVARELGVPVEKLVSTYTEELNGYGPNEHTVPVFYIEYKEINDERN